MDAFAALEQSVHAALETYSNVHRGSGHHSLASTRLYEQAADIVLEHLGLTRARHEVIFSPPRRSRQIMSQLSPSRYRCLSSEDLGVPVGVRALVVERRAVPDGAPVQPGGGTARLVSPRWIVWAKMPDRFEPGTPAIVNVIAFARALQLVSQCGADAFRAVPAEKQGADELLYGDGFGPLSGQALLQELRRTLIGGGARVPTVTGERRFVNLDNAASTPTFPPIWDAVRRTWRQTPEVHREVMSKVRSICAEVLGAPLSVYDVIFTHNTTESVNLVAEYLRKEREPGVEPVVLNTLLEHNSNELPWRVIPGPALIRLPVDDEGFFDLAALERLLSEYNVKRLHGEQRIRLVAVCGASNVQGTFNDLAEIGRIVHRHGARLLVDAAQMVAHRTLETEAWGIDYLAFSAHKVYAPFGAGVLVARKGLLSFSPAETVEIRASGEENVGGIAGLGKALLLLQRIGFEVIREEEQALTARALRDMAGVPGLKLYGVKDPASSRFAQKGGVIAFDVGEILPNRVGRALAERGGIAVRSGCHCAHLAVKNMIHLPRAFEELQRLVLALSPKISLPGVVRVSFGLENTEEDIDALVETLREIAWERPGSRSELPSQMSGFAEAAAQRVYGKERP